MSKKRKINFKHRIYLHAAIALAIYYTFSRIIFIGSLVSPSLLVNFAGPAIYGATASVIFLYIFSHEQFFAFAKVIEKKEKKAEDKWLKKFEHHGSAVTTALVGTIGGPIFGALTARFLLADHSNAYKYILLILTSIPSTLFSMGMAKGVFSTIFG